jgi:hypothetical protein
VLAASPVSEPDAVNVPVLALNPESVKPKVVVVPYSNFGVVEVEPAVMVPLKVTDVVPIAVGLLVLIETPPTALATFAAVQPLDGSTAASSFAFCSFRSAAITESAMFAAFITS